MKKILIIDDDKNTVAALTARLNAAGYKIMAAVDGLEGLKLAISNRPDLIIMDVWMPGGVGLLIAERLKALGLADVPVIFLTASHKSELWELAKQVEPAGFFEKPYDPKQLLAAIRCALAEGLSEGAAATLAA